MSKEVAKPEAQKVEANKTEEKQKFEVDNIAKSVVDDLRKKGYSDKQIKSLVRKAWGFVKSNRKK